ncbi:hypothetical protein ABD91_20205 [Lysinibacillus sphaericus]|uniref:PrgI family protein n=1 Tax=Lysinibacillus sphaericus TaxID=1421 RepID=UPI0018CEAB7E|nr:PrgI family protein [Lysinibacillus sphaericus]MBG9693078.1 hypothetical protein [Lysinibacillus sphaericus]
MRQGSYPVPPDMKEKEKVIGGILNVNQLLWLILGLAIGAGVFVMLFPILGGIPSLVVGLLFATVTSPFIFVKRHDMTLFEYLKFKYLFSKKTKHLPNKRKGVNF